MPKNQWFLHILGETVGPLSTEVVKSMLQQNRLQFADFVWNEGLTKWTRVSEVHEFAPLLPRYPDAPIPDRGAKPAKSTPPPPTRAAAPAPKQERSWPSVRRYARVPIEATVEIEGRGKFEVLDISEGGLFFSTKKAQGLTVGEDLKLKIESSSLEKPLLMTAVVIREGRSLEGAAGVALEFTRVNPAYRRILQSYVKAKKSEADSE